MHFTSLHEHRNIWTKNKLYLIASKYIVYINEVSSTETPMSSSMLARGWKKTRSFCNYEIKIADCNDLLIFIHHEPTRRQS